jgi:hypothetical protein
MQKILSLACTLLLLSSATAQDWNNHRQSVLAQPTLIRYHIFDGAPTAPNLAPTKDAPNSDLVYKTQHPIETVDLREPTTASPNQSRQDRGL